MQATFSVMKVCKGLENIQTHVCSCSIAAMKRMAASNVLIVGLRGLGVEIGEPIVNNASRFPHRDS